MRGRRAAIALLLALNPAANAQTQATAQGTDALDFFAGQGCAIGATTLAAAAQAGFAKPAIDALIQRAEAHPGTIHTGGWLVMPPDLCRMRLPDIESEIGLTDPEVVASISPLDAYASEGHRGCFLDMDGMMALLTGARGWDRERAYAAYLRLVAESLARGEATFFSPDPLTTPRGVQIVAGECGTGLAGIDAIRQDHAYLAANFDDIIRASAIGTECRDGAMGTFFSNTKHDGTPNAWTSFQAMLIVLGAGWHEDLSLTEKGMPRPPLCHYPAAG